MIRNGAEQQIHPGDLVVGDIVKINVGMDIPVDGIVLKSSGVLSDESAMTGESKQLKKEALAGCLSAYEERKAELGGK